MSTVVLEEARVKDLFKQALVELLEERRDLFQSVFAEALEDIGLARAVHEAEASETVAEPKIGKICTEFPSIVRVEGISGGQPIVAGTRLSVKSIVGWHQQGHTPDQIQAMYPELTMGQIFEALAYYEAHPEEIEAEFAEERRYLEHELPRLQAAIAERRGQSSE